MSALFGEGAPPFIQGWEMSAWLEEMGPWELGLMVGPTLGSAMSLLSGLGQLLLLLEVEGFSLSHLLLPGRELAYTGGLGFLVALSTFL